MKPEYDHNTIVALQDLVVDKVVAIRYSSHGGKLIIKLKDGTILEMCNRLWSETLEKLKQFKYKYKISRKEAEEIGMFDNIDRG